MDGWIDRLIDISISNMHFPLYIHMSFTLETWWWLDFHVNYSFAEEYISGSSSHTYSFVNEIF